jgi:hypothetical protein
MKRDLWWWVLELVSFAMVMYVGHALGRSHEMYNTVKEMERNLVLQDSIVKLHRAGEPCQ